MEGKPHAMIHGSMQAVLVMTLSTKENRLQPYGGGQGGSVGARLHHCPSTPASKEDQHKPYMGLQQQP